LFAAPGGSYFPVALPVNPKRKREGLFPSLRFYIY
jgi:hypothetical protein